MDKIPSPGDPSAYLESLMKAGQQSMKQFDEALATALGVQGKSSSPIGSIASPIALVMNMQREYFTQFWRFWNRSLVGTLSFGTNVATEPARGDKRFKDDAWQDTPYYDLLKQSYLLASKQLSEFVDRAQVTTRPSYSFDFTRGSLSTR